MRLVAALLTLGAFAAGCGGEEASQESAPPTTSPASDASPTGDPGLWRSDPEEPFPFTTPVPPVAPTAIDGTFARNVETGSVPIPCRRCAPYRLDRGTATLRLEAGRFFIEQPGNDFGSLGHFLVEGERIVFFNDPVCPTTRGTYRWSLEGDALALEVVDDACAFDLLRTRYLTAEPWVRASG